MDLICPWWRCAALPRVLSLLFLVLMFCNPSASNSGMIVTCDGVVLVIYELGELRCVMRDEGQFWCV